MIAIKGIRNGLEVDRKRGPFGEANLAKNTLESIVLVQSWPSRGAISDPDNLSGIDPFPVPIFYIDFQFFLD